MTNNMTSQNTDLSSWGTLYILPVSQAAIKAFDNYQINFKLVQAAINPSQNWLNS
jgi:hypothetical protein